MTAATRERWQALMDGLGLQGAPETCARLVAAWSEPHRHYHTLDHLEDCLEQLDRVSASVPEPGDAELALWFHDAVYDPRSTTNERDSARWAADFLREMGASCGRVYAVHAHVMATRHGAADVTRATSRWVVDVDLSILGREAAVYDRFEVAVRREYAWVPADVFRRRRAALLRSFLERDQLYETTSMRAAFEHRARSNLERAIAALED